MTLGTVSLFFRVATGTAGLLFGFACNVIGQISTTRPASFLEGCSNLETYVLPQFAKITPKIRHVLCKVIPPSTTRTARTVWAASTAQSQITAHIQLQMGRTITINQI